MERIQGKRVMVTGGAGFLGSRVVAAAREHGASEVIVPRTAQHDRAQRTYIQPFSIEREARTYIHTHYYSFQFN